jgi:hypothetical protein
MLKLYIAVDRDLGSRRNYLRLKLTQKKKKTKYAPALVNQLGITLDARTRYAIISFVTLSD